MPSSGLDRVEEVVASEPGSEAEGTVRRDVAADLEHDLGVPAKRDRAELPEPPAAADVGAHRCGTRRREAREPRRRERLSPDGEEVAEPQARAAPHLDDAGRLERASGVGAAGRTDERAD